MNLKCKTAILHMSNRTDITVSMYTITNGITILINPVSEDGDSFHCYQLHLEILIVSEQRYILTRGYAITSETN